MTLNFTSNQGEQQQIGFNIPAAVDYLYAHAYDHYIKGVCGKFAMLVREAIQAGGINTVNHPIPARMYASFLTKWGFNIIGPVNCSSKIGDIRVWQPKLGDRNNYGHIDMFDGKQRV